MSRHLSLKFGISWLILLVVGVPGTFAQTKIRVHVAAPVADGGFVDENTKGAADSFADLTERLKKDNLVDLVDENADINIEIRGRGWVENGKVATTTTPRPAILGGGLSSESTPEKTKSVTIALKAGDYEKELSAHNDQVFGAWKAIAGSLQKQIDAWIKDNRAQLLARRAKN